MERFKVIVIGAGAAGMTAAVSCARRLGKGSVAVIEKQAKVGRKLLATGNGRCNISNNNMSAKHYHGDKAIIDSVIGSFPVSAMKRFCSGMGLLLRQEDERLYPMSNSASTVLDCLRNELDRNSVQLLCETNITEIKKDKNGFRIETDRGSFECSYLIFATGSKASPSLGSDDSGFALLSRLGIMHSALFPALSPVKIKEKTPLLKGVRAKGKVTLYASGKEIADSSGEVQFSDSSVSGICVFQLSRFVNEFLVSGKISGRNIRNIKISVDLMQDYTEDEICSYLRRARGIFSGQPGELILAGALNKKLSQTICRMSGMNKSDCAALSENDLRLLAGMVKSLEFTPVLSDAFTNAQVCAGGIGSDEVFSDSLMSKRINNLYICGELLDSDGECGGYNLHFAIGSAMLVSKNIISKEQKK